MTIINIFCEDKIGLTIDNQFHKVIIPIVKKKNYNLDNIKLYCINKLNEVYNPNYPYFFVNLNNLIDCIICKIQITNEDIKVELHLNKNIYKLKFINIIEKPIYCICSSNEIMRNIIEQISYKYEYSAFGNFEFNNIEIKMNKQLDFYNFDTFFLNEIKYIHVKQNNIDCSSS